MMRVCNLDTCPMGICTQNPELRKRFKGKPEYIINYLTFVAQELREYMAKLGVRTIDELVGRTDLLHVKPSTPGSRTAKMNLDCILHNPAIPNSNIHFVPADTYDFHLENTLDMKVLMKKFKLNSKTPQSVTLDVSNTDRAFGAIFGSEITRKYGDSLPDDVYTANCSGAGGQSFGAFIPQRPDPDADRRLQRLHGQGPFRRQDHRPPAGGHPLQTRREHHHRQRGPVRCHQRQGLCLRRGRRALLRPQLRRHRRCRGRGRPRLRVYDRRHRRRPRPDGQELCSRYDRRHRLRAGRELGFLPAGEQRDRQPRTRGAQIRRCHPERTHPRARGSHRLPPRQGDPGAISATICPSSRRSSPTTTTGCCG